MGLLDFLIKPEPVKKPIIKRNPSDVKREPVKVETPLRDTNTVKPSKIPLKVTEVDKLEKCIQLENQSSSFEMAFYCPIRKAKIYCHSIIIEKLGDLTKFIISSMYAEHTLDEVRELTQMGSTTVNEELDYLIRGGLVDEEGKELTELGKQYGKLLEIFESLSEGIEVAFNVITNSFEGIDEEQYVKEPDQQYVLKGHFIPALARNDDYSNSLKIAREQILSDTPFCWEIRNSLYTTVKIEREETKYKVAYIRNFDRRYTDEKEQCVIIAIPCDRISYRARYVWIDPYREVLDQITTIEEKTADLLTDKAKLLISGFQEEKNAEIIMKDINTISGTVDRVRDDLVETPGDKSIHVLERRPVQLLLNGESCSGLYLEEIQREQLYRICYYPYSRMEAGK